MRGKRERKAKRAPSSRAREVGWRYGGGNVGREDGGGDGRVGARHCVGSRWWFAVAVRGVGLEAETS